MKSRLANVKKRSVIKGDPEDLVHIDWLQMPSIKENNIRKKHKRAGKSTGSVVSF